MQVQKVTQALVVDINKVLISDASDLGMAPGVWPQGLETDLGNGTPFIRMNALEREGEVVYTTYMQMGSSILLKVFND